MTEEEEKQTPKINVDSTQRELISELLAQVTLAEIEGHIDKMFVNLKPIPSLLNLGDTEKKKLEKIRRQFTLINNLSRRKKLFKDEDDVETEEEVSKKEGLRDEVIKVKERLVENYQDLIMRTLHQKGYFSKDVERKA